MIRNKLLHRVKIYDMTPNQSCFYDFLIGWERLAIESIKNQTYMFYSNTDIKRFEDAGFTVIKHKG